MKRPNRNDSCWCGSNQKYKKCHLATDEAVLARLQIFRRQGFPVPTFSLIYTNDEIEGIRTASRLTKRLLDEVGVLMRPGVKTIEINDWIDNETRKAGAIPATLGYKGYSKSCCISINEVICHGIPDNRALQEGDIVNVDITSKLNGFYGDASRMYNIGTVTPNAQRLVSVAKACLEAAIAGIRPFEPVNNVGRVIQPMAEAAGYSVVKDFVGHGIGTAFHTDPYVCHYDMGEPSMILVPNMVFTIEPMINEGTYHSKVLGDGWTAVTADGKLSAQWEHTIRVTESGAEVLT